MERVYAELDDAKAEIEKLRAELKTKEEISENLKKACSEQLIQNQEARSKIESLVQESNEKSDELSVVKQMCEDLKCSLNENKSLFKRLSAASDKLKVDSNEKCRRSEEEKKELLLALDEANEKKVDQERKIQGYMVEIEGLKGLLSASQKRCLEAEKNDKASKELRQRDDVLLKLEEENQSVKDQLKWKKEQFKYLEEAHEKLKCQFKESKKEWEKEKSTLIDEICSLQGTLDSQIRISEDLENRLKMCNQALAHEESRRKRLEVELSEFRADFDNVYGECQEAKSQLECLTNQRDKELAALRHALGTKEIIFKETEYQVRKLEEDNKELLASLKELREAQIQDAGNPSSLAKLRNKLRSLEQMHRDCPAKEAEWGAQIEKLSCELNSCVSALESKETELKQLGVELENCRSVIMQMKLENERKGASVKGHESELEHCHSVIMQLKLENESNETTVRGLEMELQNCHSVMMQLKLENEEAAIMLIVLRSEFTEAQLQLEKTQPEIDLYNKERDEEISHLVKDLEMKNIALTKALNDAKEESEKAASLPEKDEALKQLEVENKALAQALRNNKEEYEKTSRLLKRDEGKILEIREELNKLNTELAAKVCETHAVEFELWIWKSITQRLKDELEESQALRKQLEASLLAQVAVGETIKQEKDGFARMLEMKDKRISTLQQQIEFAEQELKARESAAATSAQSETTLSFELEKDSFLQKIREKDKFLEDLNIEIEWLEEESLRKEFEGAVLTQITAERTYKQETENLIRVLQNKDQRIDALLQQVSSLEENFNSSLMSFSSELSKKQEELTVLHEAWEKIAAAEILAQLEIEEKKLMIAEMEDDISSVQQKLKSQEKALCYSKQQAMDIEAALEAKQSEMMKLSNLMETKLRTSEAMVDELKAEKGNLIEHVTRLSSERENLLDFVATLGDRINQFSDEDLKLMGTLERILQSLDNNGCSQVQKIGGDAFDLAKENLDTHTPPATKNLQAVVDVRSPFRQIN